MAFHYIAYKASDDLESKTQELVTSCSTQPQPSDLGRLAADVAHEMMNDAVSAYVLEPIETLELSKVTKKLINTFSKVMISTSRTLINKTIAPLPPEEVDQLTQYMLRHHLDYQDTHYVSFPVSKETLDTIQDIIDNTDQSNLASQKDRFTEILQFIGRESIEVFLLRPIEMIKVGGFTRKFISISHKTMDHAIDSSVPKLIRNLHIDEFHSAVGVFREHLITVD